MDRKHATIYLQNKTTFERLPHDGQLFTQLTLQTRGLRTDMMLLYLRQLGKRHLSSRRPSACAIHNTRCHMDIPFARAVPEVQGDEILKFGERKMWWIFGGKISDNFPQEK